MVNTRLVKLFFSFHLSVVVVASGQLGTRDNETLFEQAQNYTNTNTTTLSPYSLLRGPIQSQRDIQNSTNNNNITGDDNVILEETVTVVDPSSILCCTDEKWADYFGRVRCNSQLNTCCRAFCEELVLPCCTSDLVDDYFGRERCTIAEIDNGNGNQLGGDCCRSCKPNLPSAPTNRPSPAPSKRPTAPTNRPSPAPSKRPTVPTNRPSPAPSKRPTVPTNRPSPAPSKRPTNRPSPAPSKRPTNRPSPAPSKRPTNRPSPVPSKRPTNRPSPVPSKWPTNRPSPAPSKRPQNTRDEICPKDRRYPPGKYSIEPFPDSFPGDGIEDDLNEISYIAFSTQTSQQGYRYVYTASDKEQYSLKVVALETHLSSGNIFDHEHFNGRGTTVATYTLFTPDSPPLNDDWEDISLGPCTDIDTAKYRTDQTCIYIGNIGNNLRAPKPQRKKLYMYKFIEPIIDAISGPRDQTVTFATIEYTYGAGFDQSVDKYYDAEAMFVDWVGVDGNANENPGDIYIATKSDCSGGVGKISVALHRNLGPGETLLGVSMPRVVNAPPPQGTITCADSPFRVWSGADMRRDGRLIIMIREGPPASVYFFPRTPQQTVAQALSITPCNYIASTSVGLNNEKKYEGVAFVDAAGLRFADISECESSCSPALYQYELEYPYSDFDIIQEPIGGWQWQQLSFDSFENQNWGNFVSGGQDAILSSAVDTAGVDTCNGNCACSGTWAVELHDDRGIISSIIHRSTYQCNSFAYLRISFQFKFRAYDHLDTLFLEISVDGGSTYFIVGDWAHSVIEPTIQGGTAPLTRAICYNGEVILVPSQFRVSSFGDNVKLRFRNSGDADNDRVYIDSILFQGHSGFLAVNRKHFE